MCDVADGLKNLVYGKSFACGKIATEVVGSFLFVNWGGPGQRGEDKAVREESD